MDLKFYRLDTMLQDDAVIAGDSAIVTNEVTLGLVANGALAEQMMNMDMARRIFRIHLNTDGTDSEKLACAKAVLAVSDGKYGLASRQEMAEEFYAMYGGFLFLCIFWGLLFLMATVLIIYYKQISEGYGDQRRYQIMQQVGASIRGPWQSLPLCTRWCTACPPGPMNGS